MSLNFVDCLDTKLNRTSFSKKISKKLTSGGGGGSTVVELSTTYPEIKGLIPAVTCGDNNQAKVPKKCFTRLGSALPTNIRLGWKSLLGTNTLAYYIFFENCGPKSCTILAYDEFIRIELCFSFKFLCN